MTTIVAIESEGIVTFGWDKQITHGQRRVLGGDKVFVNGGIVFGSCGDCLDANILGHATLPDPALAGWDVDRWMTRDLIPAIQAALNAREATNKRDGKVSTGGSTLVVVANRVYQLASDLSWIRSADGIYSVGSGSDFALGAIHAGADIAAALKIATRLDVYTGPDTEVATADALVAVDA